jgi:hypothetical protein
VYPPHWAPIALPLALFSWPVACRIWDGVEIATYAAVCALCIRHVTRHAAHVPALLLWTCVALAGFNGAVRWCLFEGQLGLVPLLGLCGAFWAHHEKKRGWFLACAFVASLKPQISALPLLFLFLSGARKELLQTALLVLIVSVCALIPSGLAQFPSQLRAVYELHLSLQLNQPSEFFNISPLLAGLASTRVVLLTSWALGGLCVVALSQFRRHATTDARLEDPLWQVSLLGAIEVAFAPQHGYDLVMLTPLVILASTFRDRRLAAGVVALVMLASRSHQLQERLGLPVFAPYVTLLIVALCLWELSRRPLFALRPGVACSRASTRGPMQGAP